MWWCMKSSSSSFLGGNCILGFMWILPAVSFGVLFRLKWLILDLGLELILLIGLVKLQKSSNLYLCLSPCGRISSG